MQKQYLIMPSETTTSHPLTSVSKTCGLSRTLTSLLWSIRHYTRICRHSKPHGDSYLPDERSNQYVASADLEWALQTVIFISLMIGQTWKQTPDQ